MRIDSFNVAELEIEVIRCGRNLPDKNTTPVLRVIYPGELPRRKTSHQASEKLLQAKIPPGRFYDGPVVRGSALVGHEVHQWE